MKYKITEEQLNQLIAESTQRILKEAETDEGLGSALGKGLGWLAGKTRKGLRDFGQNLSASYNKANQSGNNSNTQQANGTQQAGNTQQTGGSQQTGDSQQAGSPQQTSDSQQTNSTQQAGTQNNNQTQLIQQLQSEIESLKKQVSNLETQKASAQYDNLDDDEYADMGMNTGGKNLRQFHPKQDNKSILARQKQGFNAKRTPNRNIGPTRKEREMNAAQNAAGDAWDNGNPYQAYGINERKQQILKINEDKIRSIVAETLKRIYKK